MERETATPSIVETGRLAGLDGVRALAVLAVFAHHTVKDVSALGLLSLGALDLGALGVWTFFVLSGFLVAPIALDAARRARDSAARRASALRFFTRRVMRIAPIYYLVLAAFAFLSLAIKHGEAVSIYREAAPALWSYTANLFAGNGEGRWLGPFSHLWSLSIEAQFYLLLTIALAATPHARLGPLMAIAAVVLWIWAGWILATGTRDLPVYVHSVIGFAMMALGGAARMAARGEPVARLAAQPWLAPSAATALIASHCLLQAADMARITFVTTPLLAGVLLVALVARPGGLSQALEWRPLRLLGVVSYGFYLYHLFVISVVEAVFRALGDRLELNLAPLVAPAALVGSVIAAAASWRFIEQPLRKWTTQMTS